MSKTRTINLNEDECRVLHSAVIAFIVDKERSISLFEFDDDLKAIVEADKHDLSLLLSLKDRL